MSLDIKELTNIKTNMVFQFSITKLGKFKKVSSCHVNTYSINLILPSVWEVQIHLANNEAIQDEAELDFHFSI
jgi:hypothetical protein